MTPFLKKWFLNSTDLIVNRRGVVHRYHGFDAANDCDCHSHCINRLNIKLYENH